MADIYISSSWKNRDRVRALAIALRERGMSVYDFTDPASRKMPEIPPERFPKQFDPATDVYREYLTAVPEWRAAVECNRAALKGCRVVLLLLPCGNDSHADWALAVGLGELSAVVGAPRAGERTPSHLWSDALLDSDAEAVEWCFAHAPGGRPPPESWLADQTMPTGLVAPTTPRTDFTKPDPAFVPRCDHFEGTRCDRPVTYACDCPRCAAGGSESFYACEGHHDSAAIADRHKVVYPSRTMHLVPVLIVKQRL